MEDYLKNDAKSGMNAGDNDDPLGLKVNSMRQKDKKRLYYRKDILWAVMYNFVASMWGIERIVPRVSVDKTAGAHRWASAPVLEALFERPTLVMSTV